MFYNLLLAVSGILVLRAWARFLKRARDRD